MERSPVQGYPQMSFPSERVRTGEAPPVPTLPSTWEATALLHPYGPPPSDGSGGDVPFYQMCVAKIGYKEGVVLSAQLTGVDSGGTWWYKVTPQGTTVSTDQGKTWSTIDIGWTLPTTSWFSSAAGATWFASAPINWMSNQSYDWWKQPVPNSNATTWMWAGSNGLPFRLMFGAPPPTPTTGDPAQLALFQNFSFTYFPAFQAVSSPNVEQWTPPQIPGFQFGNPEGYELVVWRPSFGMTTLMTPVDSKSFPLPTIVMYQWKPDADYRLLTDRAQATFMYYVYNPGSGIDSQEADLFGAAPAGVNPPPNSGNGFLITGKTDGTQTCESMGLGEEPPNWAGIPAVQGTIHATVTNNPALCPGEVVTIISVLFPPTPEYPDGRFLWTWYSPFPGSNGTHSRPVTFMESASSIAEGGTSLALADYFTYAEFDTPIDPGIFTLPSECSGAGKAAAKRHLLVARHAAHPSPRSL